MSNNHVEILKQIRDSLEKDSDFLSTDEDRILQKIIDHERVARSVSNPSDDKIRLNYIDSILKEYLES